MSTDVLFQTIAFIAKCLLPVFGVILLVYIILLVRQLISTLKVVEKTVDTCNDQVKKLDAPLATVEDLSHTVDEVHHSAKDAAKTASVKIKENVGTAKDWVTDKLDEIKEKTNKEEVVVEAPVEEVVEQPAVEETAEKVSEE